MSTPESKPGDATFQPARRDLAKIALGGAALLSSAQHGIRARCGRFRPASRSAPARVRRPKRTCSTSSNSG